MHGIEIILIAVNEERKRRKRIFGLLRSVGSIFRDVAVMICKKYLQLIARLQLYALIMPIMFIKLHQ